MSSPPLLSVSKRSDAADIISIWRAGSDFRQVRYAITLAMIATMMMKPAAPRTPPINAALSAGSAKVVDICIDPEVSNVDADAAVVWIDVVVVVDVDAIVEPSGTALVTVLFKTLVVSVSPLFAVVDCADVVVEFGVELGVPLGGCGVGVGRGVGAGDGFGVGRGDGFGVGDGVVVGITQVVLMAHSHCVGAPEPVHLCGKPNELMRRHNTITHKAVSCVIRPLQTACCQ